MVWSVDTLFLGIQKHRGYVYLLFFLLWYVFFSQRYGLSLTNSIYSRFHWVWVYSYLTVFLVEAFSLINYAFRTPVSWNSLSESDVAVVTGGSNGLGLALVKSLLFDYKVARIYIIDIKPPDFSFDKRVEFCHCDIADIGKLNHVLSTIQKELAKESRHISILVNNAGVRASGSLLAMDSTQISRVFDVNTFSPIAVLRTVLSHHLHHFPHRTLSVVNVSSILGVFGPKNLSVYSASKAAMIQIHECLREELRPHKNIRMLLVMPGQLTTDMFKDISPSRLFLAPLINHTWLAAKIAARVNRGEEGVLCEPLYANFLPMAKSLPLLLQYWCRKFSQMDDKVPDT
ncbi:putative uncharacterized oxidoreductase [Clavispora lusitaniae]|uniref:Uncharacterized oxidoreductase n=1 Tax=Clavispora lusitaniae TaxID=36911 RepID=A0ACD0WCG6_CLALS|nr:short chain dehydrogenase family protein [Clavispora lusitaniae]QFZ25189.1 putative uncharacterized oxidoreductase [Clavispora lusitaniae]QFZ31508.1 putative uncharacterized oxidoreductase [Clavispora lusitaniae]QFZ37176.1 putative uncharacterized oxidoreductase [Clavispora lusitaniae]QFZ42860.1 putative uncharacterized oxidoreductase [Clavispora lusitaniae]